MGILGKRNHELYTILLFGATKKAFRFSVPIGLCLVAHRYNVGNVLLLSMALANFFFPMTHILWESDNPLQVVCETIWRIVLFARRSTLGKKSACQFQVVSFVPVSSP
ncbi:MAG: hypothetical protein OEV91_08095, partial [Desulfobulbaceae bacterium]|nr:hypothetical protein [Desulfobulbaceae bacterium]